jgi:uncharacterized protein (TIGR00730 family)
VRRPPPTSVRFWGLMIRSLCVFCGSNFGVRLEYRQAANQLGRLLAQRRIRLVYGGGNVGLMGEVADACLEAGGEVTGVIPQGLVDREVAHRGLADLRIVQSMHERKALMAELAEAFVAMPGGLGTFEEFFEIATWSQLGIHRKACGFLNVAGYYDPLLAQADHAVAEGFLKPVHRSLLLSHATPEGILDLVESFEPPLLSKWMSKPEI